MLLAHKDLLSSFRIVLASSSPRRKELLKNLDIDFEVLSVAVDENIPYDTFESRPCYVEHLALLKAKAVVSRLIDSYDSPRQLVISADTMVAFKDRIIGKPLDKEDAKVILENLSDETHEVITGVCLYLLVSKQDPKVVTFHETTTVKMGFLSPEIINAYVDTGEPLDKAGAYGIQGLGGSFVERIDGDYFNIVGLPVYKLCQHIRDLLLSVV